MASLIIGEGLGNHPCNREFVRLIHFIVNISMRLVNKTAKITNDYLPGIICCHYPWRRSLFSPFEVERITSNIQLNLSYLGRLILLFCLSNKFQFLWAIVHWEDFGEWASREAKMHGQFSDQGHPPNRPKADLRWCSSPSRVKVYCEHQLRLQLEQFCQDQQAGNCEVNMIKN
jgi:hypothetical protein